MVSIKELIFFLLFPLASFANWGVAVERAGFKGTTSVGGIYHWERRHDIEFSIGTYTFNRDEHKQFNFGYKYTPWVYGSNTKYHPLRLGVFGLLSDQPPEENLQWRLQFPPYRDYHELNVFKVGIQLGSAHTFSHDQIELAYHIMILDNGFDALTRNVGEDLRYFVSTGIGLHYYF